MKTIKIDAASATDNAVVAAVTGRRIVVLSYHMVAAGSVVATWKSATTAISGAMTMSAGVPHDAASGPWLPGGPTPIIQTEPGQALNLGLGGAVQVSGHLTYVLRP